MSNFFETSTKTCEKPHTSKPVVNEAITEASRMPTVDTSGCPPADTSKKNTNVGKVKTEKGSTSIVGTSSSQANQSKKKVNQTQKTASHRVNASSFIANLRKKEVNVVKIGTVIDGVVSIGNQFVSNYLASNHRDNRASLPPPRRRILPTVSEELKSSTLPLSVDNKYHIAEHIGSNWKKLARMLPDTSFSDGQLETLRLTSENRTELVVNILNKWHEVAPGTATVGNLAKTLERMRLNDLAIALETE